MFEGVRKIISRKTEKLSVKAVRSMRQYPPKERQAKLTHFKEDIASGVLTERKLAALLDGVEKTRTQRGLPKSLRLLGARYGLHTQKSHSIISVDLGVDGVRVPRDMSGAEMSQIEVGMGDVRNADFSTIRIHGEKLNLLQNTLQIASKNPWDTKVVSSDYVAHCLDCEYFNKSILGKGANVEKQYARRGVLFFWEGHPIGYLKLKGERSFLALRTVKDKKGYVVFWKGMVYALDHRLKDWLRIITPSVADNQWFSIDVETIADKYGEKDLGLREMKFIEDAKLYPAFDELIAQVENKQEPLVHYQSPFTK